MRVGTRRATLKDLEDIYQIEHECFTSEAFSREQLEHILRSPSFATFIAVQDGEPIGYITGLIRCSKEESPGHIYTIDVKRTYRREGVGSRLLEALVHFLAENGVDTCYLEVRDDNVAAKQLYLRCGFEPLETLKDYYGFGVDAIRLRKALRKTR